MIFVVRVHTYMRSGTSVNRIANANKRNVSRVMQRFANFFVKVSCVTNRYRPLRLLFPRLSVLTKKRNPRNKATRFYHLQSRLFPFENRSAQQVEMVRSVTHTQIRLRDFIYRIEWDSMKKLKAWCYALGIIPQLSSRVPWKRSRSITFRKCISWITII